MMTIEPASAVIGFLAGVLVTVSFVYPRIARTTGKALAVVLMGVGCGLLAWGLFMALGGEPLRPMEFGTILFATIGQTLGWAAGCLAAGVTALVVSFIGGRTR